MLVQKDSASSGHAPPGERAIEIGLVNNMPDAALESTERQFIELLRSAAGDVPVRLRLYHIPEVPRGEEARRRLDLAYAPVEELYAGRRDGLIVTGTEPRAAVLADEPYWGAMVRLLEWASANTTSTIWSCLAAHAAVLHLDGVDRRPLAEKCFGVFDCAVAAPHPLLAGIAERLRIPHSRCNELAERDLAGRGYTVLTRSAQAGVDCFVKPLDSLFVFFQGHPEYDKRALLREYRRDVGRFLRRERDAYPAMPSGYFDAVSAGVLASFRDLAQNERDESLLECFPLEFVEARLEPLSRSAVTRLYGNWLALLCAQRTRRAAAARGAARPAPQPWHGAV
jgi:homoserine O-succinyltransferase